MFLFCSYFKEKELKLNEFGEECRENLNLRLLVFMLCHDKSEVGDEYRKGQNDCL